MGTPRKLIGRTLCCAGTIISVGLMRKISYEWMENCLWKEQAPGALLLHALTVPVKVFNQCVLLLEAYSHVSISMHPCFNLSTVKKLLLDKPADYPES